MTIGRDIDLRPWRAPMRRHARLCLRLGCLAAVGMALLLSGLLTAALALQGERWQQRSAALEPERGALTSALDELHTLERARSALERRHAALQQWLEVRDTWVELWVALAGLGQQGLRLERVERRGRLVRLEAQGALEAANRALLHLGASPGIASVRLLEHRPGPEGGWCLLELELPGLESEAADMAREVDG